MYIKEFRICKELFIYEYGLSLSLYTLLNVSLLFTCRCGHTAKSEDMRGETVLLSLRRQYHCAAYNALMSVISCTQSELKFYSGLLFNENLTKVSAYPCRLWIDLV